MKTYKAIVEFIDVREIIIMAENDEEAQEKYESGDWKSEDTVNFYSNREIWQLTVVDC